MRYCQVPWVTALSEAEVAGKATPETGTKLGAPACESARSRRSSVATCEAFCQVAVTGGTRTPGIVRVESTVRVGGPRMPRRKVVVAQSECVAAFTERIRNPML